MEGKRNDVRLLGVGWRARSLSKVVSSFSLWRSVRDVSGEGRICVAACLRFLGFGPTHMVSLLSSARGGMGRVSLCTPVME